MNTKKILFGLAAFLVLLISACEPTSTAEDTQLYDQGVERSKVRTGN